MRKVIGFGSDGAAVMTGRASGISTCLRVHNPIMINIDCVAQRLALAAVHAPESIPYLEKFKNSIHNLYLFYHNSSVRMSGLHAIPDVLGDPERSKRRSLAFTQQCSHYVIHSHPLLQA